MTPRKPPISDTDMIRLTAEGMIRNFGASAEEHSKALAARHDSSIPEGQTLWLAVARTVRAIRAAQPQV